MADSGKDFSHSASDVPSGTDEIHMFLSKEGTPLTNDEARELVELAASSIEHRTKYADSDLFLPTIRGLWPWQSATTQELLTGERWKEAREEAGIRVNPKAVFESAIARRNEIESSAYAEAAAEEAAKAAEEQIIKEQTEAIEMYISSELATSPQEAIEMLIQGGVDVHPRVISQCIS